MVTMYALHSSCPWSRLHTPNAMSFTTLFQRRPRAAIPGARTNMHVADNIPNAVDHPDLQAVSTTTTRNRVQAQADLDALKYSIPS
jgi:hypothetical protein